MLSGVKAASGILMSALLAASLSVPAHAESSGRQIAHTASSQSIKASSQISTLSLMAKASLSSKKKRRGLRKIGGNYYYFYANGKKAKSTWKTINGKRYFFTSKCRAATGTCKVRSYYYIFSSKGVLQQASKTIKVVKVGKTRYLVDAKGHAVTGWQVISGRLYHASFSGKCARSTTYDKIPFNSSAYATPSNKRTKVMIMALKLLKTIVDDDMTKTQKIKACFNYSNDRSIYAWTPEFFPPSGKRVYADNKELSAHLKKDWQIDWAYTTMTEMRNNCWGQTCLFCALTKALGYDPYIIMDKGIHVSARINGKHWDLVGPILGGPKPYYSTDTKLTTKFW